MEHDNEDREMNKKSPRKAMELIIAHFNPQELKSLDKEQGSRTNIPGTMTPHYKGLEKILSTPGAQHMVRKAFEHHASGGAVGESAREVESMKARGRHGDTEMAYIGPNTKRVLDSLLSDVTGGRINERNNKHPSTGKPEYFGLGKFLGGVGKTVSSGLNTLGNAAGNFATNALPGAIAGGMMGGPEGALAGGMEGGLSGMMAPQQQMPQQPQYQPPQYSNYQPGQMQSQMNQANQQGQSQLGQASQYGQNQLGQANQRGQSAMSNMNQMGQGLISHLANRASQGLNQGTQYGQNAMNQGTQMGQGAMQQGAQHGQHAMNQANNFGQQQANQYDQQRQQQQQYGQPPYGYGR